MPNLRLIPVVVFAALCLLKDGILVAADHLLGRITPTVGLWPASRADPLGDYLSALETTIELQPDIALPGHGEPIGDPAGRARELQEHHRVRLEEAVSALGDDVQPVRRAVGRAEADAPGVVAAALGADQGEVVEAANALGLPNDALGRLHRERVRAAAAVAVEVDAARVDGRDQADDVVRVDTPVVRAVR